MQTFVWPVRVYYEDTDSGGVVFYANYLKFMERARTEWLRGLGYQQDILAREQHILFAVRSVSIDYLKPARFNEMLEVTAAVQSCGRASIVFEQTIVRHNLPEESELLSTAHITVVSVDAQSFRPKSIPDSIKKDLQSAS